MTGEQELAGSFAGGLEIVYCPASLLDNSNLTGSRFPFADRSAICRVSACGDVLDPDGDDITAKKLAVACQIGTW